MYSKKLVTCIYYDVYPKKVKHVCYYLTFFLFSAFLIITEWWWWWWCIISFCSLFIFSCLFFCWTFKLFKIYYFCMFPNWAFLVSIFDYQLILSLSLSKYRLKNKKEKHVGLFILLISYSKITKSCKSAHVFTVHMCFIVWSKIYKGIFFHKNSCHL